MKRAIPLPADDYTDSEFCTEQLINFWNVPFFKTGKIEFVRLMREAGWNTAQIVQMDRTALKKSRWNNNFFVDMMVKAPELFEDKPDQGDIYALAR